MPTSSGGFCPPFMTIMIHANSYDLHHPTLPGRCLPEQVRYLFYISRGAVMTTTCLFLLFLY